MKPPPALLVVLALLGCPKATVDSPEGAFRLWADAMRRTDVKTAFSLVSTKSQAALSAQSKALADASKGSLKDEPATLLVSPRRAAPVVGVTVATNDGARAELAVTTCREALDERGACPTGADVQERVTMVKEAQRWAVELPELVKP
ncbi:MAG: hypothetical protein SFW67_06120 [Myxococcaceae bacterium]|nr:hypothetical protein [Myxococcaceae bacterium]